MDRAKLSRNTKIYIHLIIGLITLVFWLLLELSQTKRSAANHNYEAVMILTPLVGYFLGIDTARNWSGMKSKMGQAITFISYGLLAWALGQVVFTYYEIILKVDAPYPALSDIGYLLAVPLWMIGVVKLSSAMGAKFGLRDLKGKIILVLIPTLSIIASYFVLIKVGRHGQFSDVPLKHFFDLAYTSGDIIIISIVLTIIFLSRNYFGGKFKWPILLTLFGFIVEYIADFSFSLTTTEGTFYGGDWVEILFPAAMLIIALGIVTIDPQTKKQEESSEKALLP
jgi:hypothetical protein